MKTDPKGYLRKLAQRASLRPDLCVRCQAPAERTFGLITTVDGTGQIAGTVPRVPICERCFGELSRMVARQ
jgi:hypothetical protein